MDDEVADFLRRMMGPRRRDVLRLAPALEAVDRHWVPAPQGAVAAWRVGDGPAALLVHGWEDDQSLWSVLMDVLIDRGRPFVTCDLPGHGFSEGEMAYSSEWADACLAVAAELGPIDAVVAHSAGTGPSVMAIADGLSVDRVALVAPAVATGNRWERVAKLWNVSAEVAKRGEAAYYAGIPPHRAAFRVRDALPKVDADLLVIQSSDDERLRMQDTQSVVALCPRAELIVATGLDHRRTARDPDVVRRVADFLTR
jgi:pimeloyl-ACP methyl ester carboxylesterase